MTQDKIQKLQTKKKHLKQMKLQTQNQINSNLMSCGLFGR